MAPPDYIRRTYRQRVDSGLVTFSVAVAQTDLLVSADRDLAGETRASIHRHRRVLEAHLVDHPEFAASLTPLTYESSEPLLAEMLQAGQTAGVGPFAAVAGAVAEFVGRDLLVHSREVIVENGGDVFLATRRDRILALFAGTSPLSERIGLRIPAAMQPVGVCTSAGTVGPSLSFGRADAATVVADSTALADAAATAVGNRVSDPHDLEPALEAARAIPGLRSVVVIKGETLGAWGEIELVPLNMSSVSSVE